MHRPILRINDGTGRTATGLRGAVVELQKALSAQGYGCARDGYFGPETEQMVRRFQRDHALRDDGIAGSQTWHALLERGGNTTGHELETSYPREFPPLQQQLDIVAAYRSYIESGADAYSVQAAVICGIGSRESAWGLGLTPAGPTGTGDRFPRTQPTSFRSGPLPPDGGGFGRGLMQIDYDAHEFARTGPWRDAEENIRYGCRVLRDNQVLLMRRTSLSGVPLLRAAIAAYNCGWGNVLKAIREGRDVDYFTAHRDYAQNVVNRAGWFRLHGWR